MCGQQQQQHFAGWAPLLAAEQKATSLPAASSPAQLLPTQYHFYFDRTFFISLLPDIIFLNFPDIKELQLSMTKKMCLRGEELYNFTVPKKINQ